MTDNSYILFDVRESDKFFKYEKSLNFIIKPSFNLEKENGEIIYGKELSYIGRGENSTVWKYKKGDNVYAIKIFFDIGFSCSLEDIVYESMKNIPLKKTLKAFETLKIINNKNDLVDRYGAYLMQYLEEIKGYSIVDMHTSKLLENIKMLEFDAMLLAKNEIVMKDLKIENAIFNRADSMLYIGDIDMYYKAYNEDIVDIMANNYMEEKFIIYQFLSRYSSQYYNGIYNEMIEDLFLKKDNRKPCTKKLEDLFSSYETPKQFFKENINSFYHKYF